MKINNVLLAQMPIHKFSNDIIEEYDLDESSSWVKDLLTEIEEENDTDLVLQPATMHIHATITSKTDRVLAEHFILKSTLEAKYHLPCIRCLHPLPQEMKLDLMAAFLHETKEKLPEYEESTTIFADGKEMELYFYGKATLQIKEFFHEQIFMEINQFPKCEGECVGPILF
jgi:uncharacterized metal-binding protein YceD (DUF177 family)